MPLREDRWKQWRQMLLDGLPEKGRYQRFYANVHASIPDWRTLIQDPLFLVWGMNPDTDDGVCMLDRMHCLWSDPAYSAEHFAVLLRLFSSARSVVKRNARVPKHAPLLGGRYELLHVLGRGGNGEVYLTWSRETKSLYAIKLIRSELVRLPEIRQMFRREAETWVRLGDHPNVAKAIYFDEIAGIPHITMDYIEGRDGVGSSMDDKIAAGNCSAGQIVNWLMQVADGLAHAYAHGVRAHRDIKPGNILIGRDGNARISDFGLAVPVSAQVASGTISGTPPFMSPEQFISDAQCDARSDIYSLGIVMYYLLSGGKFPYPLAAPATYGATEVFAHMYRLHQHASPKELATPFWPVIAHSLSKDPSRRFQNVGQFRAAIGRVCSSIGYPVADPALAQGDKWTLRDQGSSLMRLGKYEEAIKLFDQFLAWMPDSAAAFNRAVCLENLGQYQEALTTYNSAASAGNPDGCVNGSNCLARLGKVAEAMQLAVRATELSPDDAAAWVTFGNRAFENKSWETAMRAYEKARKLDSTNPTPIYNAGLAADRANMPDYAVLAFRAFLAIAMPDDSRRGYVTERLKRLEEIGRSEIGPT